MTTAQRIDALFKKKKAQGISARSILLQLGLSETALSEWNREKASPTLEAITLLAKYFNISADYLLCLTDKPKPLENHEVGEMSDNTPAFFGEMSDLLAEQRFVDSAKLYRAFPDEKKERVCAYILGIATGLCLPINEILGRK